MAGKFYAVKKGRKPGIYMSWDACKAQVMGFPNARYKGFKTKAEAEEWERNLRQQQRKDLDINFGNKYFFLRSRYLFKNGVAIML